MVDFADFVDFGGGVLGLIGNELARGEIQEGIDKQLAFGREAINRIEDAKRRGVSYYDPYRRVGPPALSYIGGAMAQPPGRLYSWQKQQLADLERDERARLGTSGLRGSGRAGQAVLADTRRRAIQGYQEQNRNRSDRAADRLAGVGQAAATGSANVETGAGTNVATQLGNMGSAAQRGSELSAQGLTSNAALFADTLGRIGGRYNRYGQTATT